MRILAIETATELCSAALWLEGRLLQRTQHIEHGHAQVILPMVDALLSEAAIGLTALSAIAFGRGPGAFTGVRLAASVTQGLAYGARLPVVPVSDLQALAQRALDEEHAVGRVLVCADARMHEVYWGCFERSSEGFARPCDAEHVGPPAEVRVLSTWVTEAATRPTPATGRFAGIGSGFNAYPELRRADLHLDLLLEGRLPRAAEIARLAVPEVAAGRFLPPEQALPIYLRDDVARAPPRSS